jgi:hypothetical protein
MLIIFSKKSFKCALKKVSKKSLMGALRESVVNKLQRNPSSVASKKSVVQNFRRSPSSVPKQIKKVPQKKRVQILFHPLFCKSSPQFRHFTPSYGEFTEIWKHRGWNKGRGWERRQWTSTHQYTKRDGWW